MIFSRLVTSHGKYCGAFVWLIRQHRRDRAVLQRVGVLRGAGGRARSAGRAGKIDAEVREIAGKHLVSARSAGTWWMRHFVAQGCLIACSANVSM
jgi:hypothetical protein